MFLTQRESALKGIITKEMEIVAKKENRTPEFIMEGVKKGTIAIPCNKNHKNIDPEGVGEGLSTKINVNLGISGDFQDYDEEMRKVDCAHEMGAHSIMDLSNYGKTAEFRRKLVERSKLMIGTVPLYDAIGYLEKELDKITVEDWFDVVKNHAEDGVDFFTIHCGLNRTSIKSFKESGRLMDIVSRGGSLIYAWMEITGNENPFYEHFDRLMDICREYDITISLGDSLRPGCIHDATDSLQIAELIELGLLTKRAWDKGVQVIIEGPGHMALDEIAANMKLQKRLCHGAPFYVLGPLVTDIAPGYDHITSAIGGAIAATSGADFLCYVTPAEHLRLPDLNDVKEGIVASKIAAHAADIANGLPGARELDDRMSRARKQLDWDTMFEVALDKEKAREYFESRPPQEKHSCSMCGKMCAMRTVNNVLAGKGVNIKD